MVLESDYKLVLPKQNGESKRAMLQQQPVTGLALML